MVFSISATKKFVEFPQISNNNFLHNDGAFRAHFFVQKDIFFLNFYFVSVRPMAKKRNIPLFREAGRPVSPAEGDR